MKISYLHTGLKVLSLCGGIETGLFALQQHIFYYLSGRFPGASMRDCCALVEALRTHYMCEFSDIEDLYSDEV